MRIKRFLLIALLLPVSAQAAQPFDQWLKDLRHEAASKGISNKTIDVALTGIEPIPRVIELDRKQPEGRMTFNEYYHKVINQQRIDQGRTMYRKHRAELERAARKYGVPANYIVALWESKPITAPILADLKSCQRSPHSPTMVAARNFSAMN